MKKFILTFNHLHLKEFSERIFFTVLRILQFKVNENGGWVAGFRSASLCHIHQSIRHTVQSFPVIDAFLPAET